MDKPGASHCNPGGIMSYSITLRNGAVVLFDKEDAEMVLAHAGRWTISFNPKTNRYPYVVRFKSKNNRTSAFYLHREIMRAEKGQVVDHINGNGLDNRRSNLRILTPSLNNINRTGARRSRLPVGVRPSSRGYEARICHQGKRVSLGTFETPEAASAAREKAARRLFAREAS